jgi:quercetin dioxygenase-like cupin family protein
MADRTHVPAGSSERFLLRSDEFQFLATGAQTGGAYSLTEVQVPAGGGPGPHRHPAEEWFYVLDGTALFHLDARDVPVGSGDLVRIPPGTEHWFEVSEGPVRLLSGFVPAGEEEALKALMRPAD